MVQLPLDLALPPRLGREDFLAAPANAAALAAIESWPAWPGRLSVLWGPPGAGKSHLAAIWQARSGAVALHAVDLARHDWPSRLGHAAVIDNADRLRGAEATLFHLLNMGREAGTDVLLTASAPPDRWGIRTPDLLSRLRAAPLLVLGPPDEDLLRAVLVKLFADRQLLVDETVIAYLTLRLDRSLGDARTVVDALDRLALSLGRRITRPMAARVYEALQLDGGGG